LEIFIKKEIYGAMSTLGLITLDLDGLVDDFLGHSPRCAPVRTLLSRKGFKTAFFVFFELSSQCGKGGLFRYPIREKMFLLAQFFEKPVRIPRFNLIKDNRT
jgi:hypothetical protein